MNETVGSEGSELLLYGGRGFISWHNVMLVVSFSSHKEMENVVFSKTIMKHEEQIIKIIKPGSQTKWKIHGFWWKVSKNTEKADFFYSPCPRTNICDSHNWSFSPRVKLLPWQHASAWRHVRTGGRVNGSSADHYFLLLWSTHDGIRCFRRSEGCLMCVLLILMSVYIFHAIKAC